MHSLLGQVENGNGNGNKNGNEIRNGNKNGNGNGSKNILGWGCQLFAACMLAAYFLDVCMCVSMVSGQRY